MKQQLCLIADDFTGACDSAIQFAETQRTVFFMLHDTITYEDIKDYEIVVFSTESRFLESSASYNQVEEVVRKCRQLNINHFFKKIDSTIRGNICEEVAALMDSVGYKIAIVAPSAPKNHRTVRDGHCLIDGYKVGENNSEKDIFTPVLSSYVPMLFEKRFAGRVVHLSLSRLRDRKKSFYESFQELRIAGNQVVVVDAETTDDLRMIAELRNDPDILFVGSSGLAEAMTIRIRNKAFFLKTALPAENILFVVGSINSVSRQQVDDFRQRYKSFELHINAAKILANSEKELQRLLDLVEKKQAKLPILVDTAENIDELKEVEIAAYKLGISMKDLGMKVSEFMGTLVAEIFRLQRISALFVTGGNTAAQVVGALGIKGIELVTEVLPGIPIGRCVTQLSKQPVYIVSKSGGFGSSITLSEILEYLTAKGDGAA